MKLSQLETTEFFAKAPTLLLAALAIATVLSSPSTALAQVEPVVIPVPMVKPEPNAPISAERTQAHKLFRSLTGISLPIDDARLKSMESLLAQKRRRDAAKIATNDALFYQNKVRDLARKISNRDESYRAPLSDFVATFVGVVRDSDTTSAKELLTGNFTYRADPAVIAAGGSQVNVRSAVLEDIVRSNNHYNDVQNNGLSLKAVLRKVDGQVIQGPNDTVVPMPDPAGLITTRAFMQAHADAGTNRRLVEYSFRQFMCAPITDWADGTMPDDRIGRDVDRLPGGSANKFLTTCKNCHTGMDALRGAFSKVDWNGDRITYSTGVVGKMNRNADQYPQGFRTTDDSFVNYSTEGKNKDAFGWRNAVTGNGIAQFGAMLANSQGFSRCMVKRVFESVCKRMPVEAETSFVRQMSDDFERDGYHLRNLFETVSLRPECGVN